MTWKLDRFKDKDVVFVGAGKGRALAGLEQFLTAHAGITAFNAVDKRSGPAPLGFLRDYDAAKTVFIKNDPIPSSLLPVPYVTPMQLFFELVGSVQATTIGITGTKGKSTTAALTAHILTAAGRRAVLAGNIGVSPFATLENATAETIYVLELSSYQLSDLQVSPHISACTNLYNDHSDWHGSKTVYWEAKRNIMRFAGAHDLFVYNPRFNELKTWAAAASCRTIAIDPDASLDLTHASLFGEHNRLNALLVREITRECGVDEATFHAGLNSFQPLAHRMEFVAASRGRTYIDDAIGMTPESTLASLQAISGKYGRVGCLLLGGQDRHYDFHELMHQLALLQVPALVLFPDTAAKMKAALPAGYTPQLKEATSMAEAVAFAAQAAPEQSVVLLSTAAPSYSLWKDFEDKGDQFKQAVAALG